MGETRLIRFADIGTEGFAVVEIEDQIAMPGVSFYFKRISGSWEFYPKEYGRFWHYDSPLTRVLFL